MGCATLLLALWSACATAKVDWNSRVGVFTYDQAVLELGPPDKMAKLTDGTTVADWLTTRSYRAGYFGFDGYYGGYYGPYHYPAVALAYDGPAVEYFIRLTFDPDGKLRSWKRFAR